MHDPAAILARFPSPSCLPGRFQLAAWCAGCTVLCAAVALTLAITGSVTAIFPMLALPFSLALGSPTRWMRLRRLLADRRYRTLGSSDLTAVLASVLQPHGIHELVIRAGPTVRGLARSYRAGGRAVVLIHESLLDYPEPIAFFLAHEVGHITRHDFVRRPLVITSMIACWCCGALALPLAAIGLLLIPLLVVLFNWTMELDCDRIGARWVGVGPTERAMSILAAIHRRGGYSRLTALRIRLHLTHPPLSWRLAAARAAAGAPPMTIPPLE
jgi:Zn-dependent protease with chaperone function